MSAILEQIEFMIARKDTMFGLSVEGVALSPADHQSIVNSFSDLRSITPKEEARIFRSGVAHDRIAGIPFIIDPRMESGKAEFYISREGWSARVREQNKFDQTTSIPA